MKNISSFINRCLQSCTYNNSGVGIALFRIGVGLVFVLAGVSKFVSLKMTVFMFTQVGLAPYWVYIVASIETIGGVMLILGLWTRHVAIPLGITMLVATGVQFKFGGGLMGAISPLVLLMAQVQFYLTGSTTWALDNVIGCSAGGCCGSKNTAQDVSDDCECGSCDSCSGKQCSAVEPECVCCNGSSEDCNCDDDCSDCECASKK
jgi:putative oxidoreductase